MRGGSFREWRIICPSCGHVDKQLAWDYDLPIPCTHCNTPTNLNYTVPNKAPGIATDDIPGGIEIKHGAGLINADGTPRKYYSKSDLFRACNEHGWKVVGDTPGKPYRVTWSGKQKSQGGIPIKEQ